MLFLYCYHDQSLLDQKMLKSNFNVSQADFFPIPLNFLKHSKKGNEMCTNLLAFSKHCYLAFNLYSNNKQYALTVQNKEKCNSSNIPRGRDIILLQKLISTQQLTIVCNSFVLVPFEFTACISLPAQHCNAIFLLCLYIRIFKNEIM